jgi:hypothetical protein
LVSNAIGRSCAVAVPMASMPLLRPFG